LKDDRGEREREWRPETTADSLAHKDSIRRSRERHSLISSARKKRETENREASARLADLIPASQEEGTRSGRQ